METKKTIIVGGKKLNLVLGKTFKDYFEAYQEAYYKGELWQFPIEELLDGTVEIDEYIEYWLIEGRCYETDEHLAYRYTIFMDGEAVNSTNDLQEATNIASGLFGKGYTDDIYIWDCQEDKEVEHE